jgi:hypothetical protein
VDILPICTELIFYWLWVFLEKVDGLVLDPTDNLLSPITFCGNGVCQELLVNIGAIAIITKDCRGLPVTDHCSSFKET